MAFALILPAIFLFSYDAVSSLSTTFLIGRGLSGTINNNVLHSNSTNSVAIAGYKGSVSQLKRAIPFGHKAALHHDLVGRSNRTQHMTVKRAKRAEEPVPTLYVLGILTLRLTIYLVLTVNVI